jgi:hypothetical protein
MTCMHRLVGMADFRAPLHELSPSHATYNGDIERQERRSLAELAHADRIATIGRLAASVPHE